MILPDLLLLIFWALGSLTFLLIMIYDTIKNKIPQTPKDFLALLFALLLSWVSVFLLFVFWLGENPTNIFSRTKKKFDEWLEKPIIYKNQE